MRSGRGRSTSGWLAVPAITAFIVAAFVAVGDDAGANFYAAAAQVAPVLLVAAMVESASFLALMTRLDADQERMLETAQAMYDERTTYNSEEVKQKLKTVRTLTKSYRGHSRAARDTIKFQFRFLFFHFCAVEATALYALAADETGLWLFGFALASLTAMVTILYQAFEHRFVYVRDEYEARDADGL